MERKIKEICEVLKELKYYLANSQESIWATESPGSIIGSIDSCISLLEKKDTTGLEYINFFFLPTGSLQEISIDNGWGNQFIILADRFDKLYVNLLRDVPGKSEET